MSLKKKKKIKVGPKGFSLESFPILNYKLKKIKNKKIKEDFRMNKMDAGLVGFFFFGLDAPP